MYLFIYSEDYPLLFYMWLLYWIYEVFLYLSWILIVDPAEYLKSVLYFYMYSAVFICAISQLIALILLLNIYLSFF